MRWSARHEFASMVTVLSMPFAVIAVFPVASLGFRAVPIEDVRPAGAAFVSLTAEQEKAALVAAKASWQGGSDVRRLRANLSIGELPDEVRQPILDVRERSSMSGTRPVAYAPGIFAPSQAAARPSRIGEEKSDAPQPAFSRNELLKID